MRLAVRLAILGLCALTWGAAHAQQPEWPTRSVRWIVPFGAGGTADAAARHIALKLSERWGQQVVVENKPGANTTIAASEVARATPDGYTLFQPLSSTLTINPFVFEKLSYDPLKDFTPIGLMAFAPMMIVANDTLPANTLAEYVALAKQSPNDVTLGGGDISMQLIAGQFIKSADIKLQYVPYKSGPDVLRGLLSGEIQTGLDGFPAYPPFFKSGKLRPLGVASPVRLAALPDVPTLSEAGFKNSGSPVWHGVMAPAGLPTALQEKISADLKAVLDLPDLKARLQERGLEPAWLSKDDFVALIQRDTETMGPLIKELGIKVTN